MTQSPCFAGNEHPSAAQLVVPYSRLAQALLIEDSTRTASATVFVVATAACVGVAAAVPAASGLDGRFAFIIVATVQLDDDDELPSVSWDVV